MLFKRPNINYNWCFLYENTIKQDLKQYQVIKGSASEDKSSAVTEVESPGPVSSTPCGYKVGTHLMGSDSNSMQAVSEDLRLKAYHF